MACPWPSKAGSIGMRSPLSSARFSGTMRGVKRISLMAALALAGCGEDAPSAIAFGGYGPLSGDAGRGSFRFGAATAATQIEDMNVHTDWYVWTSPAGAGGLARSPFVGDATRGYSRVTDDVALLGELGVDSYRFS